MPPRTRIRGNVYVDSLPDDVQQFENACSFGDIDWMREMIKKGVDVDIVLDPKGNTAVMMACERGDLKAVKFLVTECKADFEIKDYGGHNAVDICALCGFDGRQGEDEVDISTFLLEKGAMYSWFGAAAGGDLERLQEFIDNGQDLEERGSYGNRTAVQIATDTGRAYVTRFLMVKGAVVPRDPAPFGFTEDVRLTAKTTDQKFVGQPLKA